LFYNKRSFWLQKIPLGSKKYLENFAKYVILSYFVHLSKILMTYHGKVTQLKTIFLLPINGVNKKYWFRDFQKKFFYWFSGRIRTFYRRKTDFYEKKSPSLWSLCRLPWIHDCPNENFVLPIFVRSFQVRHFSFWITEGIGLTGVIFVFLTSGKNSVG
jgi:hypothetical protein